jgi:hypothetical protein
MTSSSQFENYKRGCPPKLLTDSALAHVQSVIAR